jgi:hypothetical protein
MLLLLALACQSPESNESTPSGPPTLAPPAEGTGFQGSMSGIVVDPYTEVWLCSVYPLPVEQPANVNSVQFLQTPGLHHITLSTFGLTPSTVPYGDYDCNDIYADSSIMENTIMMFGGAGDAEGTLQLPEGVAATLPMGIDLLHEVHFVNTTDKPVDLYSYLNAYTIDDDEVVSGIWGGSVRDEYINVPPSTTHTEWSRCVFNRDVEVHFLASHSHKRGVEFSIAPFDGTTVGEVFFTNDDWQNPMITQYNPPRVVPKGQGFQWSCTYKNEDPKEIHYGLTSEDEMCNMAVVHTPFDLSAACEVVETSDGVIAPG